MIDRSDTSVKLIMIHDKRRYFTSFFPYERLISVGEQRPFLIVLILIVLLVLLLMIGERCRRCSQRQSK